MSTNQAPTIGSPGSGFVVADPGPVERALALTLQADGKLVGVGVDGLLDAARLVVTRHGDDGAPDTAFGGGDGRVEIDLGAGEFAHSVAARADGRLLVLASTRLEGQRAGTALVALASDGSLDTGFGGGDGVVVADLGLYPSQRGGLALQTDGAILVTGVPYAAGAVSDAGIPVARFTADGAIDTGFGAAGTGVVVVPMGTGVDGGEDIVTLTDGAIYVAGYASTGDARDFALIRLTSDGRLDTDFDGDGRLVTDFGGSYDVATTAAIKSSGLVYLIVAGRSGNGTNDDFALARYSVGGVLDTAFGGDGMQTTSFITHADSVWSLAIGTDGRIVAAGASGLGYTTTDFALARYLSDGSLDTTFSGDGKATLNVGTDEYPDRVLLQSDGTILIAGPTREADGWGYVTARYTSAGALDSGFGGQHTLAGIPTFVEGGEPVVLDADVRLRDAELDAAGSYAGATLAIVRSGGANADDVFVPAAGGTLGALVGGGPLRVDGTTVGDVLVNAGGLLQLRFGAGSTAATVDAVAQQIAYANAGDAPPAFARLAWTFSDGNSGAQGDGGAKTATAAKTVALGGVNDAPSFVVGDGIVLTGAGPAGDLPVAVALQPDGRLLATGSTAGAGGADLLLARWLHDGSPDTGFGGGDGRVSVPVGSFADGGRAIALLPDGRILVAGVADQAAGGGARFALVRFLPDGSLDTPFGSGGSVVTPIGGVDDRAHAIAVQSDGHVLVAGTAWTGARKEFAIARYDGDGRLDTGFDGDGVATVAFGAANATALDVAVQTDGRLVLAGYASAPGGATDFALARLNADGSPDTGFDGDGTALTAVATGTDLARAVAIDPQGRIVAAGVAAVGSRDAFALVRYASDGRLDTGFSGDGVQTTLFGSSPAGAHEVAVLADGRIVLAGTRAGDFAIARYTADGQLDPSFSADGQDVRPLTAGTDTAWLAAVAADGSVVAAGPVDDGWRFGTIAYRADGTIDTAADRVNTLDGTPAFVEGGLPAVIDADVRVRDPELDADASTGYRGATVTVHRHGGANADDTFWQAPGGNLESSLREGERITFRDELWVAGTVLQNRGGTLVLGFDGGVDAALVSTVLQQVAYVNTSEAPPAAVELQWTLDDGNAGAQGTGAARAASGTVVLAIAGVNDAPVFSAAGDGTVRVDAPDADEWPRAVAVQPDGRIVVAGSIAQTTPAGETFQVSRFAPDGAPDTGFDDDGIVTVDFGGGYEWASAVAVQADGRIVAAGVGGPRTGFPLSDYGADVVVARYHADGRLDGSFGGDGLVAIDLGDTRDLVYAMAIQADGRILLAGERVAVNSIEDLGFLARLTTSGALDPGFGGGDGVVDVPGTRDDRVRAVAVQTDGRIVVAGCTSVGGSYVGHAMLVRYDSAGRLDTGFGTNGVSTTVHASGERSEVYGFAIAADGAIYAAADLQQADFAPDLPVVQRYLPDGRLDSQFGTDGWLGLEALESALSVATLSDGRVVVGGQSRATYWDVGAVRLLADGRFDTSFGAGNGIAYADVDGDFTGFAGMALAPDGGVVFAAQVYEDFANDVGPALGLLRLTADGQRDLAFGRAGSLGGAAEWEVGAPAAVLDADACVTDVELAAAGGYAGATLTLQRRGGPDAADAFSAHWRGTLGALDAGGPLVVDGTSVGTVEANSSGTLRLRFGEAATQERVDAVMRQIAYSNAVLGPGASVALEWTFDDGNAGAQGSGGAGRAAATTVVAVVADATPPPAPVVASATDDQPEGIGALASGAITNDATPTLAGTAEPGSTVEVLAGASTIGSTTADAAGRWQLPATALPDGETRFTAVASDSGGRASGASAPFTLTIDSRAPDAPTIAGASDDEGAQQGPLSPGSLTDDRTPALAGTAEPGSTVRVYAGASAVGTTTADASGAWAVTTAALSPGEVSLTAKASDAAGNTGGASAAFAFTLVDVVVGTDAQDTLAGTEGIDSMLGLAGDDTLRGLGGDDTLDGGPGDDRLEGGAGDDSIDGADGVDVAVFAAPRAQVTLSLNAGASGSGAAAGTGASAALGTDAFDGIERLKFADAVLALDTRGPDENAYDVVALLHCALGALPPQSELARFLPLADAGADAAAVGDAIIAHYAPGVPTEALVAFLWFQLTGTPVPAGVPESFAALVGPGLPFPTQGALYAAASMLELNTVRFAGLIADGLALPADWYA